LFVWGVRKGGLGWGGEAFLAGSPKFAHGCQEFLFTPPAALYCEIVRLQPDWISKNGLPVSTHGLCNLGCCTSTLNRMIAGNTYD